MARLNLFWGVRPTIALNTLRLCAEPFVDWVRAIKHTPWMGRVPKLANVDGADPKK